MENKWKIFLAAFHFGQADLRNNSYNKLVLKKKYPALCEKSLIYFSLYLTLRQLQKRSLLLNKMGRKLIFEDECLY